jgi:hypothetical protein
MNDRIKAIIEQSYDTQPPIRGEGRLTKEILWNQPKKLNPEKLARLIIKECVDTVSDGHPCGAYGILIQQHFGLND